MRTIQITIEETLLSKVDSLIQKFKTTRSAFIRNALMKSLKSARIEHEEARHRRGYTKKPVSKDEFDIDDANLAWGDD